MSMDEAAELCEMNIELMDLLVVIGKRFMQYVDKHKIQIEGLESHKNPIISDASYHNRDSDASDDNLPVPSFRKANERVGVDM